MGRGDVSTPCPVAVRGFNTVPQPAALQRESCTGRYCFGTAAVVVVPTASTAVLSGQLSSSYCFHPSQQAMGLMSGCPHTVSF